MITPLYKKLKTNGTTVYVFPGAAEDISAFQLNENFNVVFSQFALLRIPRQVLGEKMDYDNTFSQNGLSVQPTTFAEQTIESLRNYVANHEITMRNSKISPTEYFYNTDELNTVTERILWKWFKSLNALSLEPAKDVEDYNSTLTEFNDLGLPGNTDYLKTYLWKERDTRTFDVINVSESPVNTVRLVLSNITNYRIGDSITLANITGLNGIHTVTGIDTTNTTNDTVLISSTYAGAPSPAGASITLNYEKLVQYVGDIAMSNTIVKPDSTLNMVQAFISAQHGSTPTVLFNIIADTNYKPSMTYPVNSGEEQYEIQGAQDSANPLLTNPTNYPGDYYAHFDVNTQYTTATGDSVRRTGNYYGTASVPPTLNKNIDDVYQYLDGSTIDGISLDFNISHYSKASLATPICATFDEFNSLVVDGNAPSDFEFNAVLWYYDAIDTTTGTPIVKKNLYAIEFLDNSDNDIEVTKDFIPTLNKLVSNGLQDGTAYSLSLDLGSNLETDNVPAAFDENKIYSLFGMELYNEAMRRLALINDSFQYTINKTLSMANDIQTMKGLLYSQKSIDSINQRITYLESLLKLYSTLQIGNSDSIEAVLDTSVNPSIVRLYNIDTQYSVISKYQTTQLYTQSAGLSNVVVTSTPKTIAISNNKDFAVLVENDDPYFAGTYSNTIPIPNLELILEKDLAYKQKVDFNIYPGKLGAKNKKIDISINYNDNTTTSKVSLLSRKLDLPVYVNHDGLSTPELYVTDDNGNVFQVAGWGYMKKNTNRYLTLDLIGQHSYLTSENRLQLDGLIFKNPTTLDTYNISDQYTISNDFTTPQYLPGPLKSVSIINGGTGISGVTNGILNLYTLSGSTFQSASYGAAVGITVSAGILTSAKLLTPGHNFTPDITSLYNNTTAIPFTNMQLTVDNTIPGNSAMVTPSTKPVLKFEANIITRVKLKIENKADFTAAFDSAVSSYGNDTNYDISSLLMKKPDIYFNKGYKVRIMRILSDVNTPVTEIEKRYQVTIERI